MSGLVVFLRMTSASGRPFSTKVTVPDEEMESGQGARFMMRLWVGTIGTWAMWERMVLRREGVR